MAELSDKKWFVLTAAALLVLLYVPAPAETYVPTDDTFVDQVNPNTINGSTGLLICRTYSGWQINSLLKFDLGNLQNRTVIAATLNVYYYYHNDGDPAGADFNAYRITQGWSEDAAAWNNRPSVSGSATGSTVAPSSSGWMQWDVTSDVQAFIDETYANYGWQIQKTTGDSNVMTYFKSSESGFSQYYPYLEVTTQCSGDWGYHAGDLNRDCYVNLADLGILSQNWLTNSDPDDTNGSLGQDVYIGGGFAFDGEDVEGPATIVLLYSDLNEDVLEPNDVILEYAGQSVDSGAELLSVIESTDDSSPGEMIPVMLRRGVDLIQTSIKQGVHIPLAPMTLYRSRNRQCVQLATESGKGFCACQGYSTDDCWYSLTTIDIRISPYANSIYSQIVTNCYNGDEWGNNSHNECSSIAADKRFRLIGK